MGGQDFALHPAVGSLDGLPPLQKAALSDVLAAVKSLGVPPCNSDPGSFKAFRVAASAYFEPEVGVGDVVGLDMSQLSLPKVGTAGVNLLQTLEPPILKVAEKFEDFMLRDAHRWTSISRDASHLKPCSNPALKSRGKYLKYIGSFARCGLIAASCPSVVSAEDG